MISFKTFFLIIVLAASGCIYLFVRNRVSRKTFALLLLIRWSILALLVWLMTNPVIEYSRLHEKQRRISCLVDTSHSMSISDEQNGSASRIGTVRQLLTDLSAQKEFTNLRIVSIGETVTATTPSALRAENPASLLYTGIADFFNQSDDTYPEIYLFSDGRATDQTFGAGLSYPFAVNTVLVGNVEEQIDVAIESLEVASTIEVNQPAVITVRLNAHKIPPGTAATLTAATETNEIIGTKKISVPFDDSYSFQFTPTKVGPLIITCRVITQNITEPYLNNNQIETGIIVNKNILKILVAGQPSWDMGFILRTLASLENVEVAAYNVIGAQKKEFFSLAAHKTVPSDVIFSSLDTVDGILFCNLPPESLSHRDIQHISQFAADKGGGILFMGGPDTFGSSRTSANSGLFSLLPFRVVPDDFRAQHVKAFSSVSVSSRSPIAQFLLKTDFSALPPLEGFHLVDDLKPTGKVHLKIRTRQGQEYPLLISSKIGNGKVMAFTGRGIYKWDLATTALSGTNSVIQPLIKNIVGWIAAPSDDVFMHLRMPRLNYSLGEKVPLQVTMLNLSYEPTMQATVSGTITQPDGTIIKPEFLPLLDAVGTLSYTYLPSLPGKHLIELEGTTAEGKVSRTKSYCIVHQPTEEFRYITADKDVLSSIARQSGGEHFALEQFRTYIKERKLPTRHERVTISRLVIDYPIILLILVGLMSCEWYVRIKKGLS